MNLNLILSFVWLSTAVMVYFLLEQEQPGRGFPIPLSGLALVLALYNLVRWWSIRTLERARRQAEEAYSRRPTRRHSEPPSEPDPNFIFTDQPPPDGSDPSKR